MVLARLNRFSSDMEGTFNLDRYSFHAMNYLLSEAFPTAYSHLPINKSETLEASYVHIITNLLRSFLVVTMPSESPLSPELTKKLTTISLNWDLSMVDSIPPPIPKSPTSSPLAGTEAASSSPPSRDMTVSPDMPPLSTANTRFGVIWDLPPPAKEIEAKLVPLSTRGIKHSTTTTPLREELRLIKGYPVPPPPKSIENHPPGSSEYFIPGFERLENKAPLSSNDTASIRDFLLSMAISPPKEASSSNQTFDYFAGPELADSASPLDPSLSPPLTLPSLSERPWWAHDLPRIGTRSYTSRNRYLKSPPRSPTLPTSSANFQITKQPIPKPYRGQELSVIADLHRNHLPHINHSNCHGSLHLFSFPNLEEFKDHKIVATLKAGSNVPKGVRVLAFDFRIMTLGLYKAVVRLNLVHLGDTVTEEEIETNEIEVVDRISATGKGPQSIAFPPGFGRGEHPRIGSRR